MHDAETEQGQRFLKEMAEPEPAASETAERIIARAKGSLDWKRALERLGIHHCLFQLLTSVEWLGENPRVEQLAVDAPPEWRRELKRFNAAHAVAWWHERLLLLSATDDQPEGDATAVECHFAGVRAPPEWRQSCGVFAVDYYFDSNRPHVGRFLRLAQFGMGASASVQEAEDCVWKFAETSVQSAAATWRPGAIPRFVQYLRWILLREARTAHPPPEGGLAGNHAGDVDPEPDPLAKLVDLEMRRTLRTAVATLQRHERRVVELYFFDGIAPMQIVEVLLAEDIRNREGRLSETDVQNWKRKGIENLRTYLKNHHRGLGA